MVESAFNPPTRGIPPGSDLFLFTDLRDELAGYLDEEHVAQITDAYVFAANAHAHQKRETGEPYITHPVAVARILSMMRFDYETIMAALLHDVLEDTPNAKADLLRLFSVSVADLVDGVSKLEHIHFESRETRQAENFRKMIMAMVKDIRVILIKLADRLHNMRTLGGLESGRKKRIARETLEIYAPIANRLGMHYFKSELEDLGFAALHPLRYAILRESVRKRRGFLRENMLFIQREIKTALERLGIAVEKVEGREKNIYSIYKKMKHKHLPFHEIMDVYAFRISVDNVDSCYRVLGLVHNLYKPMPGRFKDYIAIPKANGYQSLHTVLFGPHGLPIEIQIRTKQMHRMAEQGIASHWLYKTENRGADIAQIQASSWLKGLMDLQKRSGDSLEFIEHVKVDLFPDEIYVFTPKGEILELPRNATVVDFAYAVHTDIGNSCVAGKVNRRLLPLSTELFTGQTVEILTSPGARPNPAWLHFVVTGKARSHIRHFIKYQRKEESVRLGKRLIELAVQGVPHVEFDSITEDIWKQVAQEWDLSGSLDVFAAVGLGQYLASSVAQRVAMCYPQDTAAHPDTHMVREKQVLESSNPNSLPILGTEGMVVQFGRCCWPIPGDPIVGLPVDGEGLRVHQVHCRHVRRISQHRQGVHTDWVDLQWSVDLDKEFPVLLKLEVLDTKGVLAEITRQIVAADSSIQSIRSHEKTDDVVDLFLRLMVRSRNHLASILRKFRGVSAVTKIVRMK